MKTITPEEQRTLADLVPATALVTDPVALIAYEIDGSLGLGQPLGVILPANTQEVAAVAQWAARHGRPLVARGAGTGLSGGAVAGEGGLIVSLARMKQVIETDDAGRSVVVQPGIVHLALDEYVKKRGLYYPPDPASGRACTLGGNLGENAGGPHCFKYGVTTNYVTGLQVVLAGGRTIRTGGRAYDYPELDLTGLLVGAEGTLGIITEASLRLMRNVPGIKTLMAIFDSVERAGQAVSAVIARGLVPATLEMMDRNMISIVEAYAHAGLPTDAEALLIIEADGYPESLESQMGEIVEVLREMDARELRLAGTAAERDNIWYARKSAFGAVAQISPAYLIVDGTVPRSRLAEALAGINSICAAHDLKVGYVFHAGDGNLHPLILFDPSQPEMVKRVHLAGERVMQLCVDVGGTITGEHGVGSEKRKYMPLMYNAAELAVMRDIKEVFDPQGLLNPGKILPEQDGVDEATADQAAAAPAWQNAASQQPITPGSTAEAAELLRSWYAAGQPQTLRVRGAGTKSGLLPAADAVLSSSALRGIERYSTDDLYVTVRAGTPLAELQDVLAQEKMWVPLASPWPAATVGGIVATNFNAPLRLRYGSVRDLVLAATVVMPDGRVVRAGRPVVKNVAGYDLPKLFTGSRGVLGLITDVTLKLMPFPRARETVVVALEDMEQGLQLAARLLPICLVASSLLLCGGPAPDGSRRSCALVYTAEGVPEDVAAELAQVRKAMEGAGVAPRPGAVAGSDVWGSWLREAPAEAWTLRLGVAPKDLPAVMRDLLAHRPEAGFVADIPSGIVDLRGVAPDVARAAAHAVDGYAVLLGAPQGQHDLWGHRPDGLDLMAALKARWDPRGRFNPGAFIV